MQKTLISIICWFILTGFGCSNKSARVHTVNPEIELRVIVHLETRNEVVRIMSGHEGLIYTVTTKDGRILGQNLYEQELQVRLPNIYHFLKTSYADDGRSGVAWAGILLSGNVVVCAFLIYDERLGMLYENHINIVRRFGDDNDQLHSS